MASILNYSNLILLLDMIQQKNASLQEFEKIYQFETINPASVKKISTSKPTLEKSSPTPLHREPALDLFPTASALLLEKEPIESLQLTPFAMRALKGFSLDTVGRLRHILSHERETLRSIGQSHLDEIETKVTSFFQRIHLKDSPEADLASLLRFVLAPLSVKERARIASLYALKPFCLIPLADEKEAEGFLRTASEQTKADLTHSLMQQIESRLEAAGAILYSAYIQPKLELFGGVASIHSLRLFLFANSGISSYRDFEAIDAFFSRIHRKEHSLWFAPKSPLVERYFLTLSEPLAQATQQILKEAKALLSLSNKTPPLHELSFILWKKQAQQWNALDIRSIEEILFWHDILF